jgi:hypothetical protein
MRIMRSHLRFYSTNGADNQNLILTLCSGIGFDPPSLLSALAPFLEECEPVSGKDEDTIRLFIDNGDSRFNSNRSYSIPPSNPSFIITGLDSSISAFVLLSSKPGATRSLSRRRSDLKRVLRGVRDLRRVVTLTRALLMPKTTLRV